MKFPAFNQFSFLFSLPPHTNKQFLIFAVSFFIVEKVFSAAMSSLTNQIIFDNLRDCKITPSRSNDSYILAVQSWFWNIIVEANLSMDCLTLQNYVDKESVAITEYLKRIWENHNGRYEALLRNHKEFLAKRVEIPGRFF